MAPPHAFVPTVPTLKLSTTTTTLLTPITPAPITFQSPLTHPLTQVPQNTPHNNPPSAPSKPSRILYWFRSDLRLVDNVAFHEAVQVANRPAGALVPVLLSPCSHSIPLANELSQALSSRGSSLVTLAGSAEVRLLDLCDKLNLRAVYLNRSTDAGHIQEEARVISALKDAGIHVEAFWGNALFEPTNAHLSESSERNQQSTLKGVWKDAVARKSVCTSFIEAPDSLPAVPPAVASIEQMRIDSRVGGGTSAALKLITAMDKRRETLLLSKAADLCVSLKHHLDFGSISPRMVAARVVGVMGHLQGRTFSELVWRTYASFVAHRAVNVRSAKTAIA